MPLGKPLPLGQHHFMAKHQGLVAPSFATVNCHDAILMPGMLLLLVSQQTLSVSFAAVGSQDNTSNSSEICFPVTETLDKCLHRPPLDRQRLRRGKIETKSGNVASRAKRKRKQCPKRLRGLRVEAQEPTASRSGNLSFHHQNTTQMSIPGLHTAAKVLVLWMPLGWSRS